MPLDKSDDIVLTGGLWREQKLSTNGIVDSGFLDIMQLPPTSSYGGIMEPGIPNQSRNAGRGRLFKIKTMIETETDKSSHYHKVEPG